MPNHDVVGVDPDPNRLDIFAVWEQAAKWIQAGITRRLNEEWQTPVGVMHGVVDAARALEAAGWLTAGTGDLFEDVWQRMVTAAEEPVTQAEYNTFKARIQTLNLTRRI